MNRPDRSTASGRAYLDLQRLARKSGRSMQALLPMFASERWLTRLAVSDHRNRFVLKGGVLLAALGNRRPTQDADLLARGISNSHDAVIGYVNAIASIDLHDGMTFDPTTTVATSIRDSDLYLGVRLSMDCALASAKIKLKLDVNFGDPVTPGPMPISLPTLLDGPPVEILGYPIVTVLAEKLSTAVQLGEANTRMRDYADLYSLTGGHPLDFQRAHDALLATASHRRIALRPLSVAIGQLATTRAGDYRAFRTRLAIDGSDLPRDFADVITAVVAFADPLIQGPPQNAWNPATRRWSSSDPSPP